MKYPVRTGLWFLIPVMLLMNGCREKTFEASPEPAVPTEPVTPITEIPIESGDSSPIAGRFEVVDYHLSAVAAMDEAEALNWLGQLLIVSSGAVGTQEELCAEPGFEEHTEVFADYFDVFETDPSVLGFSGPEVRVVSVLCYDDLWQGFGSDLMRISGDTLITVYDGVFLRLEPY